MNVTQSLQKWGNGAGIRIPKKVADAANVHINQAFIITLKDNAIVLTPVMETKKLTLDAMLAGVTPELVGGEQDWGGDLGAERYE